MTLQTYPSYPISITWILKTCPKKCEGWTSHYSVVWDLETPKPNSILILTSSLIFSNWTTRYEIMYITLLFLFFYAKKMWSGSHRSKTKRCVELPWSRDLETVWQGVTGNSQPITHHMWKEMWRGNHSIEQLHMVPMIKMSRSFAALMDIGFLDQFPWLKLQTLPQ